VNDCILAVMNRKAKLTDILKLVYTKTRDNADLLVLLRFLADEFKRSYQHKLSFPELACEKIQLSYLSLQQYTEMSIESNIIDVTDVLSLSEQAKQLARLDIPDDYWNIFKHMYFNDGAVPETFNTIADTARQAFRKTTPRLFPEKEIWLWDEKSAQTMVVMDSATKKKNRSLLQTLAIIYRVLTTWPSVYWRYRRLIKTAFVQTRTLKNTFGVAIHPPYWQEEKKCLAELGNIPVLIRFYCHEPREKWQQTIDIIDELMIQERQVNIALVQDREAVTNSKRWQDFLAFVLPNIYGKVNYIEVGHAINRVKWGLWTSKDYRRLIQVFEEFQSQFPKLKLMGPAVIDFEWHRVLDACRNLPKKIKLAALSQHLYVDRRGAPEVFQDQFSTLEKCAWIKSIAGCSKNIDNRVVISEFNWPLKGTGIYSPIGSPYTTPGWFADNPGFTEEEYANYLIRYLAITLCSGFIDSAFVWRLSAHGYGLIDDLDNFCKRPAFYALKTFHQQVENACFMRRLTSDASVYLLAFTSGSETIVLGWATGEPQTVTLPYDVSGIIDRDGDMVTLPDEFQVSETPRYFMCSDTHN
jgi:hypothetical protein